MTDELRELIENWRGTAYWPDDEGSQYTAGYYDALEDCADALEEALDDSENDSKEDR